METATKKKYRPTVTIALALALPGTLFAARSAQAQQPPTPLEVVSQLDYECRPVNPAPPPVQFVQIRQLNPVLQNQIPPMVVQLGPLQQLCVPVAKNQKTPTAQALPIVANSDLACYRAMGPDVNVDLKLSHINPVLRDLPDEFVHLTDIATLCLPVRKNAAEIAPGVRAVVSFIDQACYNLEEPTPSAERNLRLTHLNPIIREFGFEDRGVTMKRAHQLCVPIAKNNEVVPEPVKRIVQWADFLKYRVELIAGVVPMFPLWLSHLNPLFAQLPQFSVVVNNDAFHLMVPVAKNDQIPPNGAGAGAN